MKIRTILGSLAVAVLTTTAAHAATLYAATGSNCIAGSLYTVDPSNGASTLVGPVLVGATPVGLTGLAIQPASGVLYGVTTPCNVGAGSRVSALSNGGSASLVTIDTTTGAATFVGALTNSVGDIAFGSDGTLYGWENHDPVSLVTINTTTAAETQIGTSGLSQNSLTGLGLSFLGSTLYLSAEGDDGPLRTVNTATGAISDGVTLTGAPQDGGALNAMTTDGTSLFAVDSDRGSVAGTILVTVNTATGAVTSRGNLPNDTDALAYSAATPVPAVSGLALLGLLAALALIGFFALRGH